MIGVLSGGEDRPGSSFLMRVRGRKWLGYNQHLDFEVLVKSSIPFGFGEVSIVYSSFILLIS